MALFGSGKKSIMEDLAQQLAAHPMLQWAAQVLRRTEPRNCDQKAADAWKHCVEDYYDDGTRTVFVYRDYLGVLHGKLQQMFPSEEDERNGWKMPANDGFRYTSYGYEPLSGHCGVGYRDVMKVWTEVVRALMAASNELHFDESVVCYFTYILPRPHYEKWFKEQ